MLKNQPRLRFIVNSLLLTAGFCAAGYLGKILAIPPFFVSAVWPAAGVALAGLLLGDGYRYAFAIFLGSFLVEFGNILSSANVMLSLWVGLGIAFGATLQPCVGYYLIKRVLHYPNPLYSVRSIILFAVLSGPITCVVGASIGHFVLWCAGFMSLTAIPISWLTWWIGDAIGILVFTPLILILFEKPASIWRSRVVSVALPLLLLFVCVSIFFTVARQLEQRQLKSNFDLHAEKLVDKITSELRIVQENLRFIQNMYAVTGNLTANQFHNFVTPILKSHTYFRSISLSDSQLMKKNVHTNNREINSRSSNKKTNDQSEVVVRIPVYSEHQDMTYQMPAFIFITIQLNALIEKALEGQNLSRLVITVSNLLPTQESQFLYQHGQIKQAFFSYQQDYRLDGHHWLLKIMPNQEYWEIHRPWQAWSVIISGLVIVSLLESFLLILAGKTANIQTIVDEQTIQLRHYVAELKERNEELNQFAYIASHDLKAPMRGIENLSQWIEEDMGEKLSAESQNHLAQLKTRVKRMRDLITGILEYSRAGKTHIQKEEINTNLFLKEVFENLSVPEKFHISIQDHMPTIMAAKILLSQVFSNLISNAIKWHDKKQGNIEIKCIKNADHVEFVVADDGPGIAKEFHEKIFDLFQTLQLKESVESTGIGLAIVKKIIKQQGGEIWVQSEVGHGTEFHFTWLT